MAAEHKSHSFLYVFPSVPQTGCEDSLQKILPPFTPCRIRSQSSWREKEITFGAGSLARPSFTQLKNLYKPSLAVGLLCPAACPSHLQQGQACKEIVCPVGPAGQAFGDRALPAPLPGRDPLILSTLVQVRFISLTRDPQEDENFCYLSLVLLIRAWIPIHLQERRWNPLVKIKEKKPLQHTAAAQGQRDTQHNLWHPPSSETQAYMSSYD